MLARKNPKVKPKAVILDVDGTLCDVSTALHHIKQHPKDWDSFHSASAECPPHQLAIEYAEKKYREGYTLLVVTARMQQHRETTMEWLKRHLKHPFYGPFMRPQDNYAPDYEIKREIFAHLSVVYDIRGAIDDSPAVCDVWRELGLDVVQMDRIDWS